MQTFVNVFLGFFIFESVVAAPISDTIIYDSEFYDIPLGELPHPFAHDENKQSDQVEIMAKKRLSKRKAYYQGKNSKVLKEKSTAKKCHYRTTGEKKSLNANFKNKFRPLLDRKAELPACGKGVTGSSPSYVQQENTDHALSLASSIRRTSVPFPLFPKPSFDLSPSPFLVKLSTVSAADGNIVYLSAQKDKTDIGTKLLSVIQESYSSAPLTEETEDEASTPKLIDGSSAQGSGVLGPQTQDGLPTCLLCTCLGTTVYCDDRELHAVPPLPKKTTYFYSRYNRIKKISRNDFANLNHLKRIDLTANFISDIHKDAFRRLPQLQELVLRDNRIRQLPELPSTLTFIDVSKNRLGRRGIPNEAFKNLDELKHLYITDNNLDHIPLPLPESLQALHLQNNNIQEMHEDTFCKRRDFTYVRRALEDIRLDGNPINLSKTPYAYMCLPRLPVGNLI